MARASFKIELVPEAHEVSDPIHDVGQRFTDSDRGFATVVNILEEAHRRHFAQLRGRYVLTGATLRSLTQPGAPGAIRTVHDGELKFGTRVPWARYLTKAPKDPEAGQIRKGNSGKGRSAVVVFSKQTQRKVSEALLEWIMEPVS